MSRGNRNVPWFVEDNRRRGCENVGIALAISNHVASISSSHIYNLPAMKPHRESRQVTLRGVQRRTRRSGDRGLLPGSRTHLIPVLEAMGTLSARGVVEINSEIVEQTLVGEFTKSRAHRTTDNALVEGKNRWCANTSDTNRSEPSMPESFSVSTWPSSILT